MNKLKKILVLALATSGLCFAAQSSHGTVDQDLLRKFTHVYTKVKSNYVTPVEDTELIDHAIDGMLNVTDSEQARTKIRASLHGKGAPKRKPSGLDPGLLKELHRFTLAYMEIKRNYAFVSDEQLMGMAIQGMVSGLDPMSKFLDTESAKEMLHGGTGKNSAAVGIEFSKKGNTVVVVEPLTGSPADLGGIRRGDVIEKIGDRSVTGGELEEVRKLLRGTAGSQVPVTVVNENGARKTITLVRRKIRYESVTGDLNASKKIAYIKIRRFDNNTAKDASEELARLERMSRGTLAGLVLDLRSNPGGLVTAAAGVSDLFLDEGLIVSTDGRGRDSRLKFSASRVMTHKGVKRIPKVVLVDEQTAAGAEIVAAALQDHKQAVVIGTKTYGSGSIQTLFPLVGGEMLKLTTAYFFRPSGGKIQDLGVTPNICIENDTHYHKGEDTHKKSRNRSSCPEAMRVNADYRHDMDRKLASELILDKKAYRKAIKNTPQAGR